MRKVKGKKIPLIPKKMKGSIQIEAFGISRRLKFDHGEEIAVIVNIDSGRSLLENAQGKECFVAMLFDDAVVGIIFQTITAFFFILEFSADNSSTFFLHNSLY